MKQANTTATHPNYQLDPRILLRVDMNLLETLLHLGTKPARICSALNLSEDDLSAIRMLLTPGSAERALVA